MASSHQRNCAVGNSFAIGFDEINIDARFEWPTAIVDAISFATIAAENGKVSNLLARDIENDNFRRRREHFRKSEIDEIIESVIIGSKGIGRCGDCFRHPNSKQAAHARGRNGFGIFVIKQERSQGKRRRIPFQRGGIHLKRQLDEFAASRQPGCPRQQDSDLARHERIDQNEIRRQRRFLDLQSRQNLGIVGDFDLRAGNAACLGDDNRNIEPAIGRSGCIGNGDDDFGWSGSPNPVREPSVRRRCHRLKKANRATSP